jgi:HlyD family secretion protein
MSKKRLVLGLVVLLALGAGGWILWKKHKQDADPKFTTAPITRGDVASAISATGTLQALDTVEVGSQVSGTIAQLHADFNDRVKRGQVLAVLDAELLDAAVTDAQAGVSRAKAQLDEARSNLGRDQKLFDKGYLAAAEFLPVQTAARTAEASIRSAQTVLDRARKNRANAVIVSPTDGVVLERAIEVGQTVAASFNTPRLFTIAKDLAKMRILANVDESDIGLIKPGQNARFTVSAFPSETHEGVVEEIRLQPTTLQNVVNYIVVVSAPNPEEKLLPGMTATVDFVTEQVSGAWTVPSAALRFRPTPEMEAAMDKERKERRAARGESGSPDSTQGQGGGRSRSGRGERAGGASTQGGNTEGSSGSGGSGGSGRSRRGGTGAGADGELPADVKVIYTLRPDGTAQPRPVHVGPSDGKKTAVTPLSGDFTEGQQVITGIAGQAGATARAGQQGQSGGAGGSRGGGGGAGRGGMRPFPF